MFPMVAMMGMQTAITSMQTTIAITQNTNQMLATAQRNREEERGD